MKTIAIIGRANTGKSTLFNKLAGKKISIMEPVPGVTRDIIRTEISIEGINFVLIDSGGLFNSDSNDLELNKIIHQRSLKLISSSDIIIFLTEINNLVPADNEIARLIHLNGKKDFSILVCNKADRLNEYDYNSQKFEFMSLGLNEPVLISASHGLGIEDLKQHIIKIAGKDPIKNKKITEINEIKVCIAGKPNVGKSTLLNRLAGKDLALVYEKPGTTRDPIDTIITYKGQKIRYIDTAGLRKKNKVQDNIEYYSVTRTIKNIRNSTITLLILDGLEYITEQDKKIISLVRQSHRSLIIVVNKWDLVDKSFSFSNYLNVLRSTVLWLEHIPIITVSALTGLRVSKINEMILESNNNYYKHIDTGKFNRFLSSLLLPPKAKIFYGTQVRTAPPVFQIFVNNEDFFDNSKRNFILKKICLEFGFISVFPDLQIKTRRRSK